MRRSQILGSAGGGNSALVKLAPEWQCLSSSLPSCQHWQWAGCMSRLTGLLIWLIVTHFFFTGSIFQPALPRWLICLPWCSSIFTQTGQAQENSPKGLLLGLLPRENEHNCNFQEAEQLVGYRKHKLWVPRGQSNFRALEHYAVGCLNTMANQLS